MAGLCAQAAGEIQIQPVRNQSVRNEPAGSWFVFFCFRCFGFGLVLWRFREAVGIGSGRLAQDTKLAGFCLRNASTPAGVTLVSVR